MVEFGASTINYVKWLKQNGVHFCKDCRIKDLRHKNEGRGIIAAQDIEEHDTIFEIPRSVVLNLETCSLVKERPGVREGLESLNQWEALIIILLYELKVKKEHSRWTPYFGVLPILDEENYTFNQLMFWSDDELEYLKPSLIIQRIGKDIADGMYNKLFPRVIKQLKLVELNDTTLWEYHKIASLIMSYSFDLERLNRDGVVNDEEDEDEDEGNEEVGNEPSYKNSPVSSSDEEYPDSWRNDSFLKSMIPIADTLNADTTLHNASLEYLQDKLVIRAIKLIKKGEQVYNTYSDHPNSEILRRYGYVERQGSKHDFGEITLASIRDHFSQCSNPIMHEFFDEIMDLFYRIIQEESSEEEVVEFVLDSYDCFASSEVIIELTILLQCLTIIGSIHSLNSMETLTVDSKFQLVRRIHRKCISLIESRKLTKLFLANYKAILGNRMSEYPAIASEDFPGSFKFTRQNMANVVLKSEYTSLRNCLDVEKTFTIDDIKYQFIDDDKLIRNIVKRKFDLPIPNSPKRNKR
ncbi:Ribosomal lysine N-methyltransferase 4 [Yamadazyma tenuis]|uniref:Ribosomal lysine N-methyltransferase 4 n=1 Tax=Candida tenuis (strain ATCC 10573 / BCRC 21748 / CBS 615 / JCM 9827 / NBRC 10315 / NRRL Y-1498 / VKM Y-70) TaxID=590646 RepID=G3B6H3_CANTC|nr:putative transcription regulator [Yamadazyma tenuis ATCC 10573]EGV63468.1 putative transcription regulator [Yamadazyma tenuis ATCC 10573]WEJ96707.1 Ribosomal lysine N-methyltransferase 4 [Yamadazyma tenuis]